MRAYILAIAALVLSSLPSVLRADECLFLFEQVKIFYANTRLPPEVYRTVYGALPSELYAKAERVDRSLQARVPEYKGRSFLEGTTIKEREEISLAWAENAFYLSEQKRVWGSEASPIPMTALSANVNRFEYQGKPYIIRFIDQRLGRMESLEEGRVSIMASKLDRLFGYDIFPDFQVTRVNGYDAIVTPLLNGREIAGMSERHRTTQRLHDLIQKGELTKESLWTLQSLMFLVGNTDSEGVNIFHTPDGKLVAVDQGIAFDFGSIPYDVSESRSARLDFAPFGLVPPERYPQSLVTKLQKMTRDDWDDLLLDEADEAELDLLMYRQRFILEDIRLRGSSAIFAD